MGILLIHTLARGTMTGSLPPCCPPAADTPDWFPLHWQLGTTRQGLHGTTPLPWWSGGWYAGPLRDQLLQARRGADAVLDQVAVTTLLTALRPSCPPVGGQPWLLVPIPCRTGSTNRLPDRLASALAAALGWPLRAELLQRSRRQTPQHWLGRQQRWRNQRHSFRALVCGTADQQLSPVLLVDDVLTSGATALSARTALQAAGWRVAGLACLARTPRGRACSKMGGLQAAAVGSHL